MQVGVEPFAERAAREQTVPWWIGPAFAVLAVGTVPWVVFLP